MTRAATAGPAPAKNGYDGSPAAESDGIQDDVVLGSSETVGFDSSFSAAKVKEKQAKRGDEAISLGNNLIAEEVRDADAPSQSGFLSLLLTCYIPFFFYAVTSVIRCAHSLLVGQVRTLVPQFVLHFMSATPGSKLLLDQHHPLWTLIPLPPSVVVIAGISLLCLVVHPEGVTWYLIRKLRDAMYSSLATSISFWSWMFHDYGTVISTLLALCTFASLVGVAMLLHYHALGGRKRWNRYQRNGNGTSAPTTGGANSSRDRKRKKKKGAGRNHNHRQPQQLHKHHEDSQKKVNSEYAKATPPLTEANSNAPVEESQRRRSMSDDKLLVDRSESSRTLPALPENELVENPSLDCCDEAPCDLAATGETGSLSCTYTGYCNTRNDVAAIGNNKQLLKATFASASSPPTSPPLRTRTLTLESNDDLSFGSNSTVPTSMPQCLFETNQKQQHPQTIPMHANKQKKKPKGRQALYSESDIASPHDEIASAKDSKRKSCTRSNRQEQQQQSASMQHLPSRWDSLKPSKARTNNSSHVGNSRRNNSRMRDTVDKKNNRANDGDRNDRNRTPTRPDRKQPPRQHHARHQSLTNDVNNNSLFSNRTDNVEKTSNANTPNRPVMKPDTVPSTVRSDPGESTWLCSGDVVDRRVEGASSPLWQGTAASINKAPLLRPPPGLGPLIPSPARALDLGSGTVTINLANTYDSSNGDVLSRATPLSLGLSLPPPMESSTIASAPVKNPFLTPSKVRENPFYDEDKIEAELQELGGQMVGSVLDF